MRGRLPLFALFASSLVCGLAACGSSNGTAGSSSSLTTGSTSSGSGGSGADTGTGSDTGGAPAHTTPDAKFLPEPSDNCPDLIQGTITVSPDGKPRDVRLWISDAAKTQDGPVVFFWHGVNGSPDDATYALGNTVIDEIVAQGGIVAAPVHDPAAGQLPWYLSLGGSDESDLRVMDEVLACAIKNVGVDVRRIHSVGFSAGAMNTTQVGWRRSGYIASVVTFSGAQVGSVPDQDPLNLFPAMVLHGGPNDIVILHFEDTSKSYAQSLIDQGHFAFLCNHGQGHSVPAEVRAPAWQFLQDHPFGAHPEPYEKGLPAGFPSYCSL
jgi:predicted esterase